VAEVPEYFMGGILLASSGRGLVHTKAKRNSLLSGRWRHMDSDPDGDRAVYCTARLGEVSHGTTHVVSGVSLR